MNKKLYFILLFTIFYCYTTFSNSCSNKSNKTVYIKSYKVILKTQIMTLLTLLIIIMKFLLQYSTSKVFLKMLLAMIKGVLESKQFLSPKMLKNLF